MDHPDKSPALAGSASFPTTHWSLISIIIGAQESAGVSEAARQEAEQALEALCRAYWFPLYAYARRRQKTHEEAQDLTQDFFADLTRRQLVQRADSSISKFRTFLLTQFDYLLSNQHRREQAAKRGGSVIHVSIDGPEAEARYQAGFAACDDPVYAFDLAWASEVVEQALAHSERDYASKHADLPFDVLRAYLPGGAGWERLDYEEIHRRYPAANVGAIRVRVNRLRTRFRELARAIVAETVANPASVDEEMQYLVSILARQ